MATLNQQLEKSRSLTPARISRELFQFIKSIESEIFDLNIKQIEKSENAKGQPLVNKDTTFDGVYSKTTDAIASGSVSLAKGEAPNKDKIAGEPYNFDWTGDFFKGFEMTVFADHVELFSTGEGTGDKKTFFDGYESLYGLTPESIKIVIETRLIPFLNNYSRTAIGI